MKIIKTVALLSLLLSMQAGAANNVIRISAPVFAAPSAVEQWRPYDPLVSAWENQGEPVGCAWSPEASTVADGKPFTQSAANCQQTQSRTLQAQERNIKSAEIRAVGQVSTETQIINLSQATRTVTGTNEKSFYRQLAFGRSISNNGVLRAGTHKTTFDGNANFGTPIYNNDGYAVLVYFYRHSGSTCYAVIGAANGSGWNNNTQTSLSNTFISRYSSLKVFTKSGQIANQVNFPNGLTSYYNGHFKTVTVACATVDYIYANFADMDAIQLD